MNIKGYIDFVKWYFVHIGNRCFDNSDPPIHSVTYIKRKHRLATVIFCYILIALSLLSLLFVGPYGYVLAVVLMIIAIGDLCLGRFGFLYYFLLYAKYVHRDDSVNDRVIVDEIILLDLSEEIRKVISKYYRVIEVKGNIFTVKYSVVEKTKKYKKLSNRDLSVLKITPNKMLLNKKVIFTHKISDLSDLDIFLREAQKSFD